MWWRTFFVRMITLGPTLAVAVAVSSKNNSLDEVSEWLNIVQSIVLPFALLPVSGCRPTHTHRLPTPPAALPSLFRLCYDCPASVTRTQRICIRWLFVIFLLCS